VGTKRRLPVTVLTNLAVATSLAAALVLPAARPGAHAASSTVTWLVRTDPVINPWERSTIQAFEKAHPDIQIQLIISPPGAAYDQKLLTLVASGNPPSIFSHWGNDSWADFVYRGVAADLSPYISASQFSLDGMDSASLGRYTIKGQIYGIPFASGGSYLFYNADLFRAAHLPLPPTSWNDKSWNWATLQKDSQALTKDASNPSKAVWGLYPNLYPENAYSWLFGGDIFTPGAYSTGVVSTVTANSPAVLQSVKWQADVIRRYKIAPSPTEATALSTSADPFIGGRIGMEMTGIWGFWVFTPAKFKWGVAPLPYFSSHKNVVFTDPWMMAKQAKEPKAAWAFLQYLASPQYGDKTYVAASGVFPPWKQLAGFWAQQMAQRSINTPAQLLQLGTGSLAAGQESINHLAINYGQFDDTINNVLQPVWTGSTSPQAAVQNLQAQLGRVIEQANISPGGYVARH